MMLSLTDYQENANQSQNYISSHTPQNGYHGYQDQIKEVLVRMLWEKKELLTHCWWEGNLVQPLLKIIWRFLKKLRTDLPCDPAGHIPKGNENLISKTLYHFIKELASLIAS